MTNIDYIKQKNNILFKEFGNLLTLPEYIIEDGTRSPFKLDDMDKFTDADICPYCLKYYRKYPKILTTEKACKGCIIAKDIPCNLGDSTYNTLLFAIEEEADINFIHPYAHLNISGVLSSGFKYKWTEELYKLILHYNKELEEC